MLANPLLSPYFVPTLTAVAGLLGGTLLILWASMRFRLDRLGQSILFLRWRTWAIIAPVFALAILSGELTILLLLSLLAFVGLKEYSELVGLPASYRRALLGMGLLATPAALASLDVFLLMPAILLAVATLQPVLLHPQPGGVRHLAYAVLGWGYIPWFLAHLALTAKYVDGGPGILLAVGLATALSDVGAFVVGSLFGHRPLAPRVSPRKTWEGTVGNVLGAYVGTILMASVLPDRHFWVIAMLLPLVIALGAIWGDLVESAIKREFHAKDTGSWVPGFGGLLDRIDSLLIVGPLVYYFLRLLP